MIGLQMALGVLLAVLVAHGAHSLCARKTRHSTCVARIKKVLYRGKFSNRQLDQALCTACRAGCIETASNLLDAGADPNAKKGLSLSIALQQRNFELADTLFEYSADLSVKNWRPLKEGLKVKENLIYLMYCMFCFDTCPVDTAYKVLSKYLTKHENIREDFKRLFEVKEKREANHMLLMACLDNDIRFAKQAISKGAQYLNNFFTECAWQHQARKDEDRWLDTCGTLPPQANSVYYLMLNTFNGIEVIKPLE